MTTALAAIAGLVFGLGLLLSGMADPANIRAFLDVTSPAWDPRLMFVMGGAVLTALPAFAIARRRQATLLGTPLALPPRGPVDARLVIGALIFGVGWGLSGLCPGPALLVASGGSVPALAFVACVALGYVGARTVQQRRAAAVVATDSC